MIPQTEKLNTLASTNTQPTLYPSNIYGNMPRQQFQSTLPTPGTLLGDKGPVEKVCDLQDGSTIIQKQIDGNLASSNQADILDRIVKGLPSEIFPASTSSSFNQTYPSVNVGNPAKPTYFQTSRPTLKDVTQWLISNGSIRYTSQDIYAVMGFLVGIIYECEERMVFHPRVSQDELSLHNAKLKLSNPFLFNSAVKKVIENVVGPIEYTGRNWDPSFYKSKVQRNKFGSQISGISKIDSANTPEIANMIQDSFIVILSLSNLEDESTYYDISSKPNLYKVSSGINVHIFNNRGSEASHVLLNYLTSSLMFS